MAFVGHSFYTLIYFNTDPCLFLGVTHIGGDMFKSVPAGDALFMKVRFILLEANYWQETLWSFTKLIDSIISTS